MRSAVVDFKIFEGSNTASERIYKDVVAVLQKYQGETQDTIVFNTIGITCWKSGLYPLDRHCLLLLITPGTSPCTMDALDRIVVPKIQIKIVLTIGDYFKRVSFFSNFYTAVRLLAIP